MRNSGGGAYLWITGTRPSITGCFDTPGAQSAHLPWHRPCQKNAPPSEQRCHAWQLHGTTDIHLADQTYHCTYAVCTGGQSAASAASLTRRLGRIDEILSFRSCSLLVCTVTRHTSGSIRGRFRSLLQVWPHVQHRSSRSGARLAEPAQLTGTRGRRPQRFPHIHA